MGLHGGVGSDHVSDCFHDGHGYWEPGGESLCWTVRLGSSLYEADKVLGVLPKTLLCKVYYLLALMLAVMLYPHL